MRETRGTESLLTVEWEGIQTGDHPDSDVKGFLVEYRSETERHWMVHSGIIPYKGPNHQYRVQVTTVMWRWRRSETAVGCGAYLGKKTNFFEFYDVLQNCNF